MGNPPFQGGKKITGVLGTDYRDYLLAYLANGKTGNADLCAYFFLRGTSLARYQGMCALLATNSIAQGDTREVGLEQIVASGWTIRRAISSYKWPGEASLEVAHVWLRNGPWDGNYILDNKQVSSITSFLTQSGKTQGNPYELLSNANQSFQGSVVLGMGFVLDPEEAQALIAKDSRNKDVLFPYLNGEDLNSRLDQSPSRWVINFHDWPLEKAETYPDCLDIVKEKVKPERDRLGLKSDSSARGYARLWWQFARKGLDLYSVITNMERVLVRARIANTHSVTYVPNDWVYNEKVVVFAKLPFSVLQSNIHECWARNYSSTLRSDMQYTPSNCFDTFPFPPNTKELERIGERYHTHRQSIMLTRQEGLTKTYNRFHNPPEQSPDIIKLRELHKEMDEAAAHAYGWDDLKLEHGFHETKQGLRYTISESARREVLDRLLLLNHERHEEEVRAGLFETKGAKGKAGKTRTKKESGSKNGKSGGDVGGRRAGQARREGSVGDGMVEVGDGGLEQGTLF
jgi:hypothetical protein